MLTLEAVKAANPELFSLGYLAILEKNRLIVEVQALGLRCGYVLQPVTLQAKLEYIEPIQQPSRAL